MLRLLQGLVALSVLCGASLAWGQVSLEPVSLAHRHTPGETVNVSDSLRLDLTVTFDGAPQPFGMERTQVVEVATGQPDGQGIVPVTHTIRSIVNEFRLRGATIRYDSANPAANANADQRARPLSEMFQALIGGTMTYRISPDGIVTGIDGVRAIVRNAPDAASKLLARELDEERLKRDVQQELDALPRDPVQPGDSWTRTEVLYLGGGQSLSLDRRYEYVGQVQEGGRTYDKVALRDEEVRYVPATGAPPRATVKSSDLKIESSEGALTIDRERGRVARRELATRIHGILTLVREGAEAPIEVDLKLQQRKTTQ